MTKRILNILCEGQSEQAFALKVLRPYLMPNEIIVRANLLITNRKLNAQGGMISFQQVKRDLHNMMSASHDTPYEKHFFTTMFDLYELPPDFPGFPQMPMEPYTRVKSIEEVLFRKNATLRESDHKMIRLCALQ